MAMVALSGCTLFTTDVTDCETTEQCRDQFGVGFVCNADGLCEGGTPIPRCTTTYPEDLLTNPQNGGRIVIGDLMDRSIATQHARELSARLALSQANAQGGLEGQNFGLVMCTIEENPDYDGLTRSQAAVTAARYLIDHIGVSAIIGPASSGDTQATFLEIQNDDVLLISPSATSPTLTQLDPATVSDEAPGLLWRTAPPDSLQGAAIAADMRGPGAGRAAPVGQVAAIYAGGAYGGGLYTEFAGRFTAAGGAVTPLPFADAAQRDTAIAMAATANVDEVLFISSQPADIIAFLDTAATLSGYDQKTLFLTDAAANADVLTGANSARFSQVRGSRPAPLDESRDLVYAGFIAAYTAEYGADVRPFSFTANAYDAAWLVAYGAAWAIYQDGEVRGQTIAQGLRKVSGGTEVDIVPTSWNLVKQSFQSGQAVDVEGASGQLDYDPATEETSAPIEIWEIQGGAVVGVDTFDP